MSEPAAWQRGQPLEALQAIAGVFKARHKPLVFGAFGLTKERDIADALADGALVRKGPADAPRALAIVHRLKAAGGMTDFAGRDIAIPAGHAKVTAFAALDAEAGTAVLRSLQERCPGRLWVEAFEEDETARQALKALPSLRYRATKIAAGSEVKGLYSDAPAASERQLHAAEFASLVEVAPGFATPAELADTLAEAEAFANWAQHYSSYNLRKSWTAYALRGFDPLDPTYIIKPAEMAKGYQARNPDRMAALPAWTDACPNFPHTMRMVARILDGREAERVRLMRLTPGGELSRHADVTDRDAGLADGKLARLHLPLRTSAAVIFHGWDKRGRHIETRWPAGSLCYLDQRGPHRVENRDPACERIHLVLDVRSDAALRERIAAADVGPQSGR